MKKYRYMSAPFIKGGFLVGRVGCLVWTFLSLSPLSHGQFIQKSSVQDSSGTRSSSGGYTNISAVGQPGGITESSGGGYANQAGFLNTFWLQPLLDTDGDGLPDELDLDNDNDGISDPIELAGSAFIPVSITLINLADTDGDGQMDGWEAVAGTDPNNMDAAFELVAITNAPSGRGIAWIARGNNQKTYIVRARTSLIGGVPTVIFSNTVAGGTAPWFVATNSIVDISGTNVEFYAVEVLP